MPESFKKGDIIYGRNRNRGAARHPVVYLDGDVDDDFTGVILTHSNRYPNNVFLPQKYFNNAYPSKDFKYDNSYLVSVKLTKRLEWGPYRKVGEMTVEGINFIEESINGQQPIYWDEYIDKNL